MSFFYILMLNFHSILSSVVKLSHIWVEYLQEFRYHRKINMTNYIDKIFCGLYEFSMSERNYSVNKHIFYKAISVLKRCTPRKKIILLKKMKYFCYFYNWFYIKVCISMEFPFDENIFYTVDFPSLFRFQIYTSFHL